MAYTNRKRLNMLERQIKAGKEIQIRLPLPGADLLLARYGFEPGDVFIPDGNKTGMENKKDRAAHKARKRYIADRAKVGFYNSRQVFGAPDIIRTVDNEVDDHDKELLKRKLAIRLAGEKDDS